MKRLHLVVGFAFVGAFVGTGAYMGATFPGAYQADSTMQMLFRSAHIYILLTALLNGLLGLHLRTRARPVAARLQAVGSICLLATPVVMTLAFFLEPATGRLSRPWVFLGVVLVIVGASLHLLTDWLERR